MSTSSLQTKVYSRPQFADAQKAVYQLEGSFQVEYTRGIPTGDYMHFVAMKLIVNDITISSGIKQKTSLKRLMTRTETCIWTIMTDKK